MAVSQRAPKQWSLTTNETITSFESWKNNLVYVLSLDSNFAPFLGNMTWTKKSTTNPNRGLNDDGNTVAEDKRLTAAQKVIHLDLMLGFIANFCPIISRNSIVKSSTSLSDIWQKIRQHYGFQSSGSHFLDLALIKRHPDERYEDLYQRITAFFDDNLLTVGGGIKHHGAEITVEEEMTPSLENVVVYLWLSLIHQNLPSLVKQKYGTELRNQTLSSIKPEISQAMDSLLDELRSIEDTKAFRAVTSAPPRRRKQFRSCILCKTANRPHNSHNLEDCKFLPERDRKLRARTRLIPDEAPYETDPDEDYLTESEMVPPVDLPKSNTTPDIERPSARRVDVVQSPYLKVFYKSNPVKVTIDTGATTNMVLYSFAKMIGLPISPASQSASQADGVTPLNVVGETHSQFTRDEFTFNFNALVVKNLDVDMLAGTPFLSKNDITPRVAKNEIIVQGHTIYAYGPSRSKSSTVRRTQSHVLRADKQSIIFPGEYLELQLPAAVPPNNSGTWALEPRFDSPSNFHSKISHAWPEPQEIESVGNVLRVVNTTSDPIHLKRNEHFCHIRAICEPLESELDAVLPSAQKTVVAPYSKHVTLDPDNCLSSEQKLKFSTLHREFDQVFNPAISLYNGASGKIEASVNVGPTLPPQRKGRIPCYNRATLVELQEKCDELENAGVLSRPEDLNVHVEYLNTSFLVRKPNGGSRFVTSFGEVAKYSKPQPSLMPNVDAVLRDIARWKYIITTDLHHAYYQIPLSHKSLKYCGVSTPFKGIRVYTRSAMGMPGSESYLEELLSRILGDMIQEGYVAKIADDLYCGGDSIEQLLSNWCRLLEHLANNNLRLSAPKTVICPATTTILGWIWSKGTLSASPHKLSALSAVDPPMTVRGLRSFIGAFKVLSRVLKGYAEYLHPLDTIVAGRGSNEKIEWSESMLQDFRKAQASLKTHKAITLPKPEDILWIVTDASVKNHGIGATLYVLRSEKLLLAGFFNAKLKKHQIPWLPCEVEALAIGAAVKHFSPYIIQSHHPCQVLTDSRPCVQSFEKLQRGEFSSSSRVTTFLSIISRFSVTVRHITGVSNLSSDFISRNPSSCNSDSCQVCKFVHQLEDSVVREISVSDITEGSVQMPFTSRVAWIATQHDCADLRRVHSHLSQGTRPSKKATKIPDVKRYLNVASIASDGLLVVKNTQPFTPLNDRIIIPRSVLDGFLTALHIRFNHPSTYQLKKLFSRYFFALDLDKALSCVSASCHHCVSLKSFPIHMENQSSEPPPKRVGSHFAADVVRRFKQCIMVLRETVTSYTVAMIIGSERHEDLRDAILTLCSNLHCVGDGGIVIRVDGAPGFSALKQDRTLVQNGISLQLGNPKNCNKNPVAESAVRELCVELLKQCPQGGPVHTTTLALAVASLNSRIRHSGLSAMELWTQRDQFTGEQLPIDDQRNIIDQHLSRMRNHPFSSKSKAKNKFYPDPPPISIGSLVVLKFEKDKTRSRDKYLVTRIDGDDCFVRKFTSSQFRSKEYKVPILSCHPLSSNSNNDNYQPTHEPIRGLDNTDDEDSTSDQDMEGMLNSLSRPKVTPHPPEQYILPNNVDPSNNTVEIPPDISEPPKDAPKALPNLRRSLREKKPPAVYDDSEWLYYK